MNKAQIYQAIETGDWPEADSRAVYNTKQGPPKIMPAKYQADSYRKFKECLLIFDNFLEQNLLKRLQTASFVMAKKTQGWARPFQVKNHQLIADPKQFQDNLMQPDQRLALENAIDEVTVKVHQKLRLLTQGSAIVKYNSWINTGSLPDSANQDNSFHFWHYDSDEYMEFCMTQDWLRFPVWGVILYINEPADEKHYTLFDDNKINQKVRSITNRLVIFDPSYMHKVIGTNRSDDTKDTRLVMVFNAWDYDALDHAIYTQTQSVKQSVKEAKS